MPAPASNSCSDEGREGEGGGRGKGGRKLGDKEREAQGKGKGEGGGIGREGKQRDRKSGREGGRERESNLHPEPLRHHLQRKQVPLPPSLLLASSDAGKGGSKG